MLKMRKKPKIPYEKPKCYSKGNLTSCIFRMCFDISFALNTKLIYKYVITLAEYCKKLKLKIKILNMCKY